MPNWVKTRIEFKDISDERYRELVERFTKEDNYTKGERCIDFDTIIPMPDNIYRGNLGQAEREKYGSLNWYDWSCSNWGTKWNACDGTTYTDSHEWEFSTAWSFAKPVIAKLAELAGCTIVAMYADEDFGYNVGLIEFYDDGSSCAESIKEDGEDAWTIIEELWGISREEHMEDEKDD